VRRGGGVRAVRAMSEHGSNACLNELVGPQQAKQVVHERVALHIARLKLTRGKQGIALRCVDERRVVHGAQ
jgi:hypothetical protein